MSTNKNSNAFTYLFVIGITFALKMAVCDCQRPFENALFNAINKNGSLSFSPSHIYGSLQFANASAKKRTQQEIDQVIKGYTIQKLSDLNANENYIGFLNDDSDLMPCVQWGTDSVFQRTNYNNSAAAKDISAWATQQSNGYIKDFALPKNLSPNTLLTVMSTLYLNVKWEKPFTSETKTNFKKTMLQQQNTFLYGELKDLNAVAVELPFETPNLKHLLLMPHDNDLQRLSKQLLNVKLYEIQKQLKETELNLYFPKAYGAYMKRSLIEPLQELGIREAFTKNANFGRLQACGDDSYIRDFRHFGAIHSDAEGMRFMSLTAVQWDLHDGKIKRKKVSTYSGSSDGAVKKLSNKDDPEIQQSVKTVSIDRPYFYALLYHNQVVFAGTMNTESQKK